MQTTVLVFLIIIIFLILVFIFLVIKNYKALQLYRKKLTEAPTRTIGSSIWGPGWCYWSEWSRYSWCSQELNTMDKGSPHTTHTKKSRRAIFGWSSDRTDQYYNKRPKY